MYDVVPLETPENGILRFLHQGFMLARIENKWFEVNQKVEDQK